MHSKRSSVDKNTEENQYIDANHINQDLEYEDEYDEEYVINFHLIQRHVICWNCDQLLLAGLTWDKVQCPICHEVNIIPDGKPEIGEYERILEMKLTKITCVICKKVIYTKRESDYLKCTYCNTLLYILKNVPLRPATYGEYTVVEATNEMIKEMNKTDPLPKERFKRSKYDTFKPLFETVRENKQLLCKLNNLSKQGHIFLVI